MRETFNCMVNACFNFVLVPESNKTSFMVPSGQTIYPFSIQLPFDLPQTFKATHGRLLYYAKATLQRPLYSNFSVRKPFTVRSIVDLSTMPQAVVRPIHSDNLLHLIKGALSLYIIKGPHTCSTDITLQGHMASDVSWRPSKLANFVWRHPGKHYRHNKLVIDLPKNNRKLPAMSEGHYYAIFRRRV